MELDFTEVEGWMQFGSLNRLRQSVSAHVLAWRFKDDAAEAWTKRIKAFKDRDEAAVKGAAHVLRAALPALMERNGWVAGETVMTNALSSGDTQNDLTKPLPRVGRFVAAQLGMVWMPSILTKDAHRSLHYINSAAERDAEAAKAKYCCSSKVNSKRIIVLDDLITRGITIDNIAGAILEKSPSIDIHAIALGKSEKKSYATSYGRSLNNEHVPAAWAALWNTT